MTLLRFLLVGIANTLVGLSCIYFAMYFLHLGLVSANAFGYAVGMIVSFALNKTWTFGNHDHVIYSFIRYLVVLAVAYYANLETVLYADAHYSLNPYLVQTLGIVPYTAIGFLGSRYFAFPTQKGVVVEINDAATEGAFNKIPLISRAIELGIVIPCYNEEAVLLETTRQLAVLLQQLISEGKITPTSRVYYVDDGSRDRTWGIIESLTIKHEFVHGH